MSNVGLAPPAHTNELSAHRQVALVDLLDRLLADGVVVVGELTLAIADVDLVHISLHAVITSAAQMSRTGHQPEIGEISGRSS
jgi:Gas vesicle protein